MDEQNNIGEWMDNLRDLYKNEKKKGKKNITEKKKL